MTLQNRSVSALVPTSAFVLLWSSGAIVSEIGLQHGSPLTLLILRCAVAFVVLVAFAFWTGRLLPAEGSRTRAVLTGLSGCSCRWQGWLWWSHAAECLS